MDIATRQQFVEYWNRVKPGLGDDNSELWVHEREFKYRSEWFIAVEPLVWLDPESFWEWCDENLSGTCGCYSSDDENKIEWWGFSNRDDVIIWALKWCDGNAV